MKRTPVLISLDLAATVIAAVCYIPFPHHIDCAFEVQPESSRHCLCKATPGRIDWTVEPKEYGGWSRGRSGCHDSNNPDLRRFGLAELQGEESVLLRGPTTISSMRSRNDRSLKAQIDTQQELLESIQSMREKTEEELERLTVRAKRSGIRGSASEPRPARHRRWPIARMDRIAAGRKEPRRSADRRRRDLRDHWHG